MHNLRLKDFEERDESIDKTRSKYNKIVINEFKVEKTSDLQENLSKYYKDKGAEVKKDSVLMLDFVLTTSPEYWGNWKNELENPKMQQKLDDWVKIQVDFMKKEFPGLVKLGALHLDEKTPHLHFQISTEETKTVVYKNRHGSTEKVRSVLNAKRWSPAFFIGLVDRHAEISAHMGLKRGERGSEAKKTPLKDYKLKLNETVKQQNEILAVYQNSVEEFTETTAIMLKLQKSNQILMKKISELEKENNRLKGSVDKTYLDSLGL